ncbi:MAG TPA: hypothetical protein VGB42_03445 [Candidatus Thermoplasmatota archaeon]
MAPNPVFQVRRRYSAVQAESTRRQALLKEISDAEARLGRLVLDQRIPMPVTPEAVRTRGHAGRLAFVLAGKIQDLRNDLAAR